LLWYLDETLGSSGGWLLLASDSLLFSCNLLLTFLDVTYSYITGSLLDVWLGGATLADFFN
jgi:hypothetical protein